MEYEKLTGMQLTELDVNTLFEKLPIKEVQEIEKKIRNEIDKKKEDLRQMVGERYRDIIEAADRITDMKISMQKVLGHLHTIENICSEDRSSVQPTHKNIELNRSVPDSYTVVAQVRLSLDLPSRIWSYLEDDHYLGASQLYLLGRHIHTNLQIVPPAYIRSFVVISRFWSTMTHLKTNMLNSVELVIREENVPVQKMSEALCTLLLLGDMTPRQIFNDFLLARTATLREILNPSDKSSAVKDQICRIVNVIANTLDYIYTIFYSADLQPENDASLKTLLTKCQSFPTLSNNNWNFPGFNYLPENVIKFHPIINSPTTTMPVDYIQQALKQWCITVDNLVTNGVTILLTYVNTMRGVAAIRRAVFDSLSQLPSADRWNIICQSLLQDDFQIWEKLIQQPVNDAINRIVQNNIDHAASATEQQITKILSENPHKIGWQDQVSQFVWSASKHDLPQTPGWVPASMRKPTDGGSLWMKTRGFTTPIQLICTNLNTKLQPLTQDVESYITSDQVDGSLQLADISDVLVSLQKGSKLLLNRLVQFVKDEAIKQNGQTSDDTVAKIVFLGHLCLSFTELVPNIQQCISATQLRPQFRNTPISKSYKVADDAAWIECKIKLTNISMEILQFWKSKLVSQMKDKANGMLALNLDTLLQTSAIWSNREIEEESESGSVVKSTIHIPYQPSSHLLSILQWICQQITAAGGHTLHRGVVAKLQHETLSVLYDSYNSALENSDDKDNTIHQGQALQIIYDLHFILSLLSSKETKPLNEEIQKLVGRLEEFVDPFDLDVFTPYIQSNLRLTLQRSMLLFGLLVPSEKLLLYSGPRATSSIPHEQPCTLPLVGSQPHFILLPVSSSHISPPSDTGDGASNVEDDKTLNVLPLSTRSSKSRSTSPSNGRSSSSKGNTAMSSSFFGSMSSSWFGSS